MSRVTRSQVEGAFTRAVAAARSVELNTHGWYLLPGKRSIGEGWRLLTRPGGGDPVPGLPYGMLGMSAREARDTLLAMAIAWEAVQTVRDTQLLGELGELNSG